MNDPRIQSVLPLALAMSGCMLVVGALPAVAQDPNRQEDLPVRERQRPELDPVGLRQGNVFFYPSIGVAEAYVSNVFATEKDEKDDFVTYRSEEHTSELQSLMRISYAVFCLKK